MYLAFLRAPRQGRFLGCALTALALSAPNAEAALSSYTGSATLSYSIDSIVNQTNPGDLSNLQIDATFEQFGAPNSFELVTGDGTVTANTPGIGLHSVASPYTFTFSTSGDANSGTVNASNLGSFWLGFTNLGTDSYQIRVTLNYALNATASGQSSDSAVHLDYYNQDSSFSGFDDALAFSGFAPAATQSGSSGAFLFTLTGAGSESLVGDITISGNLEAAAVPVPPAIWLFLSGCAALIQRRRGHANS
jgi:hypothetical protein